MAAPLRQLLASAVAARRQEAAAALEDVPDGVFNHLDDRPFVLFTTIGRTSGLPREKFWGVYGAWGDTLYMLEEIGERAQWVRNIRANPAVEVRARVAAPVIRARARIVTDAGELVLGRAVVLRRVGSDWGLPENAGLLVALDAQDLA